MDGYVPLPPLPARLSRLNDLAYDVWWSWNAPAREVFRDLDYPLWRFTEHNPVLLLHLIDPQRLAHAAEDPEFLRLYDMAIAALDLVRAGAGTWWSRRGPVSGAPIALVCPEFALHHSLPLNTGSLGVAAGDFCKEASDLGVPIVGVGLMYPRGYMHQRLSGEGWQQEAYEYLDWSDAPIRPALQPDGAPCVFPIAFAGGDVRVQVWQVRAGRVTIYLLDPDVTENAAWDRELASGLVDANGEAAVRRGVLLGAGASRALARLGIEPGVWHVHEAASAFVVFDRVDALLRVGVPYDVAVAQVQQSTVFDTWHRAPARSDHVPFSIVDRHLGACWPDLSRHRREALALGAFETDRGAFFNAGALGTRAAATVNAPALAEASIKPWPGVEPGSPARVAIPPGVHLASWISRDLATIIERHLGADWRDQQDSPEWGHRIAAVPDEELWDARQRLRGYLVDFTRERARRRWAREHSSGVRLVALGTLLDPMTLTIGLARWFTADSRADMLFHDTERLAAILTATRRPVQIVIAGKAQPADDTGKHHLQRVFRRALDPLFGGRVAFLEDYDLHAARLLVQGCDAWLSLPASGCPALGPLKAGVNGAPHLSADEGTEDAEGVAQSRGNRRSARTTNDVAAARAIYRRLEDEIVPAFYERDRSGLPARWMAIVKETLAMTVPHACARRTVKSAADRLYSSVSTHAGKV